jgi:peptide/nickel transport system permease protein
VGPASEGGLILIQLVLRRALLAGLLVVAVSSTTLILTRLAPGDLSSQLGPFASPDEIARIRARFDLDRPLPEQWLRWMGRAARLDFGDSFLYSRPVADLLLPAAAHTGVLGVAALATATLLGVPLGLFTGLRRGVAPAVVRAASLVCLSAPPLLTSLALVSVASSTGWLPLGGMTAIGTGEAGWAAWVADVARHLPVPVLALALPLTATFERLQAQAIVETMGQPFVGAAVARGVPPRRLVLAHAWRVSLRSLCGVYGLAIGAVLSGSFVVEFVTAWPGLGRLMFEGLRARDIYLVSGCAAVGAAFLALGTLASDVLLALVDPRARGEVGS